MYGWRKGVLMLEQDVVAHAHGRLVHAAVCNTDPLECILGCECMYT